MNVPEKSHFVALDGELDAKAKALRERIDSHAYLPELKDDIAAYNNLLQAREFIKAILNNLDGDGA